nr:PREDICTED: oxidation resistance protein 1-like [Bos indicus]
MSVTNLSWLKKKSQSVDITAPGFNPLAGAGKQMPQASKPPAPKTPIIEEEQNNAANSQKHPSRRSELKRFYTIGECHDLCK